MMYIAIWGVNDMQNVSRVEIVKNMDIGDTIIINSYDVFPEKQYIFLGEILPSTVEGDYTLILFTGETIFLSAIGEIQNYRNSLPISPFYLFSNKVFTLNGKLIGLNWNMDIYIKVSLMSHSDIFLIKKEKEFYYSGM